MANFQMVPEKEPPTPAKSKLVGDGWGSHRLFVVGDSGVEKIPMQLGTEIELEHVADSSNGGLPTITWNERKVVAIAVTKRQGNKQRITVNAYRQVQRP